ncbi:uncharacterized protein Triagg1_5398 [Trichoderma aggressivum f. europaeum]|uniref:Actin-like ATPase domain-containing protein n=1 Tax=Trichoderma aggressivum f. europaeum TaxID=173218 RepID=A0AAE1J5S4_9HYPO|nr:hypothetical protein Triagg1_5398 [Trichoderma aggressivum f. europaeum]
MAIITPRTKLLVGIDYGTTYSGVCFALSNASDFKDINTWTKYPGAASHSAQHTIKAPTRVAFPEENDDLDRTAWGYEVEAGMKSYSWTKLLLDDTLPSEFDVTDTHTTMDPEIMRLPNNMSAKDVAREYLAGMRKMFDENIKQNIGAHELDDLPMEFWITVPTSWNERTKLLTKSAAMEAGFGKREVDSIRLIPEPEAAAHMALKTGIHRFEGFVKPKTGVLVCDCGGGTVDITTYEIERTEPTLTLREIVVGVAKKKMKQLKKNANDVISPAGKCGDTCVDRNLLKLLSIVREKKCQKHYGHALAEVYNPSLHSNYNTERRCIYKDVMDRVDRLTGFMFWQIPKVYSRKGTLIDSKTEINSEFVNNYRGPVIKSGEHFLYSCSLDAAPSTIDDNRVETIGRILYTLHDLDWSQVPNVKQLTGENGETCTEIPLVLNIRLDDEVGHLVFRILCNGREAGKAKLDLDY